MFKRIFAGLLIVACSFTYVQSGCRNGNLPVGPNDEFCCVATSGDSYSCTDGACWFCWGDCTNGEPGMESCLGGPLAM